MKKWGWIALAGLCILAGAAVLYWIARPPQGDPIQLLPAPTPSQYQVYVVGAVLQPGLYSLPPGSRVNDAIRSAGGFQKDADQVAINLAAMLVDGDRILVPTQKIPIPTRSKLTPSFALEGTAAPATTPGLININTASLEELDTLPGIGPVTAGRIIAYRQLYGTFKTIQDITNVEGVGPALFSKIKALITVGG